MSTQASGSYAAWFTCMQHDMPSRLFWGVCSTIPARASFLVAMMMGPSSAGTDFPLFTSA